MHGRIAVGALFVFVIIVFGQTAAQTNLALSTIDGQQQSLEQYRGKVVVLNFWATWCVPCKEEMPILRDLAETYAERGVVVIAASLDDKETRDKVPKFVKKQKIAFPVWVNATADTLATFQLGESLPSTAILDRDGHILARVLGQLRKNDIADRLNWLLAGKEGPAPAALVDNLKRKGD